VIGTPTAGSLWLISGVPGSGKSSVADALARKYPRGVHIAMDDMRAFVRSGIASPLEWNAQTALQFEIARRSAARMAADYVAGGFSVVIDDVMHEGDLPQLTAYLGQIPLRKVLLSPSIFVVHRRNAQRTNKTFDTKILEPVATRMHGELLAKCPPSAGWVVLDTSTQSVNDTVDTILQRFERVAV
jgi:adenylylsulfate kinase-like enzyme